MYGKFGIIFSLLLTSTAAEEYGTLAAAFPPSFPNSASTNLSLFGLQEHGNSKIEQQLNRQPLCTAFTGLIELPCILPFTLNGLVQTRCGILSDSMIIPECPVSSDLKKWGVCNRNCYDNGLVETYSEEDVAPILVELVVDKVDTVCGGALISAKHVLIAAHCIKDEASITESGKIMTKRYKSDVFLGNAHDIEKVVVHSDFNRQTWEHDIAIVFLKTDIRSFEFVNIGKLVRFPESFERKQVMKFAGWATKKERNRKVYQEYSMLSLSRQICSQILRAVGLGVFLSETQVCAGNSISKIEGSTCSGQKEGILYYQIGNKFHLVGLLSSQHENCQPYIPSVFVHIDKYLNWIENNTSLNLNTDVKDCTTGLFVKKNGSLACGIYLNNQVSASSAREYCKLYGASLPDIRSEEENDFYQKNNKGKQIWLDASRIGYDYPFTSGGTGLTYSKMVNSGGRYRYSNYDCVYLGLTGDWNEANCYNSLDVICEKILTV